MHPSFPYWEVKQRNQEGEGGGTVTADILTRWEGGLLVLCILSLLRGALICPAI